MKPKKYLLLFSCILALMTGCRETVHIPTTGSYKMLRVKQQDYTFNRQFMAKIESQQRIAVRPAVGGTLVKICVAEGSQVKQGQPVFVIDQAPYVAAVDAAKAQVATARATLATAKLNAEGKEKLYAQQMVGEFDLRRARHAQEEAAAQLESAQAALNAANTDLKFTTITSPVDGRISIIDFRVGEVVDPSMEIPIATISANSHIYAYTSISEAMLSNFLEEYGCRSTYDLIKKLPAVTLSTTWGEKMEQQGHIDAINSTTDASTGAVLIRASFNNPTELFRNGSNGYIDIPTTKHGVYVIPQDATIHIQDKYFVYRVIDGKAVSTEVKVLPPTDDQQYVVTSGLNEDDVIIAEHAGMVSEGMTIGQDTSTLALSALCTGSGEETTQAVKDSYRILKVKRQDFTLNREFMVKVESRQYICIRPVVSGRLAKICVQEGAWVKKGQPMFIIDQAPFVAAVDAAQAQVSTARAALSTALLNLEGKEKLYAQQMVGEFDLRRARHAKEEAAAQLQAAQAELAAARTNLGYATICSPVDGVVGIINLRVGDFVDVNSEKEITMVNKTNEMYAYTSLSEEMLSGLLQDFGCSTYDELLSKLPPVKFYSNSNSQHYQEGRIDAIDGIVDPNVGATFVRVSFVDNTGLIRTGTNGYIVLPYVMHQVIVIPQEAAVDIHDKYLVYKVVDGKTVETEITVMPYNDGKHFVVTSGLAPGDSIIAEGAGLLSDGIEVTEKKDKKGGEQL